MCIVFLQGLYHTHLVMRICPARRGNRAKQLVIGVPLPALWTDWTSFSISLLPFLASLLLCC